uniref:Dual 3',5'-cyclic-AMP and -GMP phosphodiesterase 11A-like n=2 Tax=Oryzias melastigma TaxID=30732 RepID=A0A3B3DYM2_ORYME
MLMTACDLGAVTRPWKISKQVAELVTSEFFEQGDRERSELKLTPAAIFDRNRKDELPALQLEWIDGICKPLYQALLKLNRKLQPMLDGIEANRERWQELCLSRERTRRATVSSLFPEPGQNIEPSDDVKTSENLERPEKDRPSFHSLSDLKFKDECIYWPLTPL